MRIRGRALFVCVSCTLSASVALSAPAAAQIAPSVAQTAPFEQITLPVAQIAPVIGLDRDSGPTAATSSPRIFTHLLKDSLGDFRRLASSETAVWLGIGGAVALFGYSMDRSVTAGMSAAALDDPFEAGDTLGAYRLQLGSALATYAIGHVTGHARAAAVGADLLRAQLLTKMMTVGLKVSINRTRPDGTPWSFPSGHTSASFASATIMQQHFGWKVGLPAYAAATYVAASRIQEKRHFLSDVAFGAAIGIVAGRTVTVGRGEHRFALAPVGVPGGAALSFSLVGRQ